VSGWSSPVAAGAVTAVTTGYAAASRVSAKNAAGIGRRSAHVIAIGRSPS